MKKNCKGLKSRVEIIEKLAAAYISNTAPDTIVVLGQHGSGKSFVIQNILDKLKNEKNLDLYIGCVDEIRKYDVEKRGNKSTINSLELTGGYNGLSLGIGIGWNNNDSSSYSRIRNAFHHILNKNILICIDNFSSSNSEVKLLIKEILHYKEILKKDIHAEIYILVSDYDMEEFSSADHTISKIYELLPYNTNDISEYLCQMHEFTPIADNVLSEITKLSNGNLTLANLLYQGKIYHNENYLDAINTAVDIQIKSLKESGRKKQLDENELEEIIFSASLSLQQFTSDLLSEIVNQEEDKVLDELDVSQRENIIISKYQKYYDFLSNDFKTVVAKRTLLYKKKWLMDYYAYYSKNKQDDYFHRAYYLLEYFEKMTPASFSLLILAYSAAIELKDDTKIKEIENVFNQFRYTQNVEYCKIFKEIKRFYKMISSCNQQIDEQYNMLSEYDEFELPLKLELARAYFRYLYSSFQVNHSQIRYLVQYCQEYALHELCLDIRDEKIDTYDESILRLRVIYDISPCVLDVFNKLDDFNILRREGEIISKKFSGAPYYGKIGEYIKSIFDRKAFLYIHPTQCFKYYDSAKKFFKENEIWHEYCITLVCEAGTNLTICQYEKALRCCDRAIKTSEENNIVIPLVEKLYNNKIIASFLLSEKQETEKKSIKRARDTIKELKGLLTGKPCSAEYVIMTNICSLSLYCDNIRQYRNYKAKLEQLYGCKDISDIKDYTIDDFYRYYFSWFELFLEIKDAQWEKALQRCTALTGFVPALFKKQEIVWDEKVKAAQNIIEKQTKITAYDFCNNLVINEHYEKETLKFFQRGLMLSDLQYTSYY